MAWMFSEHNAADLAQATLQFGLNWLIQSSLLIGCGLLIGWLLRRNGSAVRSAVYRTTLIAVVASPVLSYGLSQVGVTGLSLTFPTTSRLAPAIENGRTTFDVVMAIPDDSSGGRAAKGREYDAAFIQAGDTPVPVTSGHLVPAGQLASSAKLASDVSPVDPRIIVALEHPSRRWEALTASASITIGLLWVVVAIGMFIHLAMAWWNLVKIRRRAVSADAETIALCHTYAKSLGVAVPDVLETPFLPSPCVAGITHPVILLPEETLTLSLNEIIIHELAHLRRKDCHWNLLRKLTTTVLWFHPLLWVLSRRLEMAAEEVCDDFVVKFGGDREEYALRLVDVAEFASARIAPVGVAMVSLRSMLAHRVTRILDCSRQLSTGISRTSLVFIFAGGLVGTMVAGFVGAAPPRPKAADNVANQVAAGTKDDASSQPPGAAIQGLVTVAANVVGSDSQPQKRMAKEVKDGMMTIRGRVLTPDGRPAAGATVTVRNGHNPNEPKQPPLAITKSEADGRFDISIPSSPHTDSIFWVAAQLEGYGFQLANWKEVNEATDLVLKLVADATVRGRITDLEGKPIEGVSVRLHSFYLPKTGENLDAWLESAKSGALDQNSMHHMGYYLPACDTDQQSSVLTDQDGRFAISGIGPERRVAMTLRGKTIAYQTIDVVTRNMAPMTRNVDPNPRNKNAPLKRVLLGMDFNYPAQPMQLLEGIVRDAKTKKGVAGVHVQSEHLAGTLLYQNNVLRTQTDAEGRYQLVGLPKGDDNVIQVYSNGETAYQLRQINVPKPSDASSTKLDIDLDPGVWVTGKVTDKATGQPVKSVIQYLPFRDNPFTRNRPEFNSSGYMDHRQFHYKTDEQGNYRIPGLPGRAIVVATSEFSKYRKGNGADKIKGLNEQGNFDTFMQVVPANTYWHESLKEIHPVDGSAPVTCDLELDPGVTIPVTFVDPEGNPVDGVDIVGRMPGRIEFSQPSKIDVGTMSPNETRTIQVIHRERQLGRIFDISYDGQKSDPITITLPPTATIKGRLIDQDGVAVKDFGLVAWPNFKATNRTGSQISTVCKADGTFELSILPTGCESYAINKLGLLVENLKDNIAVKPGEVVDVGDLKLKK